MRGATTTRFALSLAGAAALHGVVFGVAALVWSGQSVERPGPVSLDVDVVDVTAPKPDPSADSAPSPGGLPAKLVGTPPRRHARVVTPAPAAASAGPTTLPVEAPDPSAPDVPVGRPTLVSSGSRPSTAAAPGGGASVSAQPRYRTNPIPDYPIASRRRGEEGVVLLDVLVQSDGLPATITVNRSCGHPLLDRAALDAVRRWTFEPARAAGVPVSSLAVVPVRFSLSEGPGR